MGALTLFNHSLPAHIAAYRSTLLDTVEIPVASAGLPYISIKNSRFTIVRGKEETTLKDTELFCVVVGIGARDYRSWYAGAYDPKAEAAPPECWSPDNTVPSPNCATAQSETCALCPKNEWGSGSATTNRKACNTHRRIVLVAAGDEAGDKFVMNIPGASLAGFGTYLSDLKRAKGSPDTVVTKISFATDAVGKLEFDAVEWLTPEQQALVSQIRENEGSLIDTALTINFEAKKPAVEQKVPVPPPAPGRKGKGGFGSGEAAATAAAAPAPAAKKGFSAPPPTAAAPASAEGLAALEADLDALIGAEPAV